MFGLFSTLLSNFMNLGGQAAQFAQSKELAELQNQFNIDMWNRNNEYNTPQAQMQRFSEAGLNPNLIYGMGTAGNSSSPPQKVVPQAPDWVKGMSEAAKSFNIEQLRTLRANRKKAEADAENAKTNATRNERELNAEYSFGQGWTFDTNTGQYVRRPDLAPNEVRIVHPSAYYVNRILEQNYRGAHLIPAREALLEQQRQYLIPQVQMAQYDQEYYPISYWIDRGARAAHGVSDIVGIFNPIKWMKPTKFKRDPIRWRNPYNQPHFAPDTY